mgnify:CR=1 FL=1
MRAKATLALMLVSLLLFGAVSPVLAEQAVEVVTREVNGEILKYETDLSNLELSAWRFGAFIGERYPTFEVVTIGGIPWQDTKYAQVIKDNLFFYGTVQ